MKYYVPLFGAAFLLVAQPSSGQQIEEVRAGSADAPTLPEDLFRLPPGAWVFAKQLWKGDDPCTADECEAGYTSGDLVVSVERHKKYLRVVAGFRGCVSVAWNEYEIGNKASSRDTRTISKRLKQSIGTSAKHCKVSPPTVATLDARQLYPIQTLTQ